MSTSHCSIKIEQFGPNCSPWGQIASAKLACSAICKDRAPHSRACTSRAPEVELALRASASMQLGLPVRKQSRTGLWPPAQDQIFATTAMDPPYLDRKTDPSCRKSTEARPAQPGRCCARSSGARAREHGGRCDVQAIRLRIGPSGSAH